MDKNKDKAIDHIWDEYLMDFDGHPNDTQAVISALHAAYEAGAKKEREKNEKRLKRTRKG